MEAFLLVVVLKISPLVIGSVCIMISWHWRDMVSDEGIPPNIRGIFGLLHIFLLAVAFTLFSLVFV